MGLQKQVMDKMKEAMKLKDTTALTALRALKAAFMLANTETGAGQISEDEALKIIQKQVKQRKDSATIFAQQGRQDLATPELTEAKVLEQFLPEALSEQEIAKVVAQVIEKTGATGMKDMGKVMGIVSKQLAGQADGATISTIVKQTLA
ncbi:GatB/YqeY domain-containing protein [Tenacibaculum aestuariivivum]|uniref:GatB/YqeY domain-containing protein n=1 Tax=Tenacibaculum aestuariivivum TaxID=2006131 RepID=UPI003AB4357C